MPVYEWKGFDAKGRKASGVIDADSPRDARVKCRRSGNLVTSVAEVRAGRKVRVEKARSSKRDQRLERLKAKLEAARGRGSGQARSRKRIEQVGAFIRQLATLTRAGIPITEALRAIIEQTDDKRMNVLLRDLRERITQGSPTADAMAAHPDYFDELAVAMVRAGEASGHLDEVLTRLAAFMQEQTRMRNKVAAALTYPLVMLTVGILVVAFLITIVVPKISTMLESQGRSLPLPTQILVGLSDFFRGYWWTLVLAFIFLMLVFNLVYSSAKGRLWVDRKLLDAPIFGDLLRKQAIARFARTFATLLRSGVSVVRCLEINRKTLGNKLLEQTLDEVRERILEGQDIATPIKKSGVFPPMLGYMIAVGEQSGDLDEMMEQVADAYQEEVELATQRFTSLIEPILIIFLAGMVGFIILAILIPVLQLTQSFS